MTRFKAAGIHLAISVLIGALVTTGIVFVWFPGAYLTMGNGLKLVTLLIGCDVVLGPLLTFVVFQPGKPSLRFDLSVIALIQAAALAYGISVAAQARPVFGVLIGDVFYPVPAQYLREANFAAAQAPYNRMSWTGPIEAEIRTEVAPWGPNLPGTDREISQVDPTQYTAPSSQTWAEAGISLQSARTIGLDARLTDAIATCSKRGTKEDSLRIVDFVTLGIRGRVLLDIKRKEPCAAIVTPE